MTTTFAIGDDVTYAGALPCDETSHGGTVIAVTPDASGDSIVTVEFDCPAGCKLPDYIPSRRQDIPASELTAPSRMEITAEQVQALEAEAGQAGDLEQAAICRKALEGDGGAWAECERVIAAAAAMGE